MQPRSFSATVTSVTSVQRLRSLFEDKKGATPEPVEHGGRKRSITPATTVNGTPPKQQQQKEQHRRSGSLGPFIRKKSERDNHRISLHRRNTDDSTNKGSDRLSTSSRPRSWLGGLIDTAAGKSNTPPPAPNGTSEQAQKLPPTIYNPIGDTNGAPPFGARPTTPQNRNNRQDDGSLGVLPSPAATTIYNRSVTDLSRAEEEDRPPLPLDAEGRRIRSVVRHSTPPTQHQRLIAVQGEDPGEVSPIKDSQVRKIMGTEQEEEDPDKTLTTNNLALFDEFNKEFKKDGFSGDGGDVSPMDSTFNEARERKREVEGQKEGESTRDVSPVGSKDARLSAIRNSDVSPISERNNKFDELTPAQQRQLLNGAPLASNGMSRSLDIDREQNNKTPVPAGSGTAVHESEGGQQTSAPSSAATDNAQQAAKTPDTSVSAFGFVHVSPKPQMPTRPSRPDFAGAPSGNGQFSTAAARGFETPVDYDHWDQMSIPDEMILTPTVEAEASRHGTPELRNEQPSTFGGDLPVKTQDAKRLSASKRTTPPLLEERALLNDQEGPKVRKREIRRDPLVNGHDAVPGARVRLEQRRQQPLLQALSNAVSSTPLPNPRKLETEMYVVRVVASPEGPSDEHDDDLPPPPPPKDTPEEQKPPKNVLTADVPSTLSTSHPFESNRIPKRQSAGPTPTSATESPSTATTSRRQSDQSHAPQLNLPEILPLNIQKFDAGSQQASTARARHSRGASAELAGRSRRSSAQSASKSHSRHASASQELPKIDDSTEAQQHDDYEDEEPSDLPTVKASAHRSTAAPYDQDDTLVDDDETIRAAFAQVKQEEQRKQEKEEAMVSLAMHPAFRNSNPPPNVDLEALQKKESPKYEDRVLIKEKETAVSDDAASTEASEEDELYADDPAGVIPPSSSEFQKKHQHQASIMTTASTIVGENELAARRHAAKDSLGVNDVRGHHRGASDRTWSIDSIESRPMSFVKLARDETGKPIERINTISRSARDEALRHREQKVLGARHEQRASMTGQTNAFAQISEEPREDDNNMLNRGGSSSSIQAERFTSSQTKEQGAVEPDATSRPQATATSPGKSRHVPIKPMDPGQEHIAYQLAGYKEAARKALEAKFAADPQYKKEAERRQSPVQPDTALDPVIVEKREQPGALSSDNGFVDKFKFKGGIMKVLKPNQPEPRLNEKASNSAAQDFREIYRLGQGNRQMTTPADANGDRKGSAAGLSDPPVGKKKRFSEIFKRSESNAAGGLNIKLFNKNDKSRLSTNVSRQPTSNAQRPTSGRTSRGSNERGPSPLDGMDEDDEGRPSESYARSARDISLRPIEEARSPVESSDAQRLLTPPLEPTYDSVPVPGAYDRSADFANGQLATPPLSGDLKPPSPVDESTTWRRDPRNPFGGPSHGPARKGRKFEQESYAASVLNVNPPQQPSSDPPATAPPPKKPMFSNPFKSSAARASTTVPKPQEPVIVGQHPDMTYNITIPSAEEEANNRRFSKPQRVLDAPTVQKSPPLRQPQIPPAPLGFNYTDASAQPPPPPGFREVPPRGAPPLASPPYTQVRAPSPPQETVVPPLPTKIPPMSMPVPVQRIDTERFEDDAHEHDHDTFLSDATPANSAHPSDQTGSNSFPSPGLVLAGVNGVPAVPRIPDEHGVDRVDDVAKPEDSESEVDDLCSTDEWQEMAKAAGIVGPNVPAQATAIDAAPSRSDKDANATPVPQARVPSVEQKEQPKPQLSPAPTVTEQIANAATEALAKVTTAVSNATTAVAVTALPTLSTTEQPLSKSVSPLNASDTASPTPATTKATTPSLKSPTPDATIATAATASSSTPLANEEPPSPLHYSEKQLVDPSHFADKEAIISRKSLDEKQVNGGAEDEERVELPAEEEPVMYAVSYPGMEWMPEYGWDGS